MTIDIDELEKLIAAATPEPWESVSAMPAGSSMNPDGSYTSWAESPWTILNGPPQAIEHETVSARFFKHAPDTQLIVALRNSVPALIVELRAARTLLAELDNNRQSVAIEK